MSLLTSLEKKLGHLAVPHLVRVLAGFQVAVWVMIWVNPGFEQFISLHPDSVMHGQVWRLLTWVFDPGRLHPIWLLFAVLIMFTMGDGLEQAWGPFRVNLYVLGGIASVDLGALIFGYDPLGVSVYSMIFLAFAMFFPDFEFLLFLILPVKVKYLAWLNGALLLLAFIEYESMRLPIVFSLVNFAVAFGPHLLRRLKGQATVMQRRARFDSAKRPEGTFFHQCVSCGKTELDDPHLEFRVTAEGEEYCSICRPRKKEASQPS